MLHWLYLSLCIPFICICHPHSVLQLKFFFVMLLTVYSGFVFVSRNVFDIVPITLPKYVNLDKIGQQEETTGHLQEGTKK
jgi:hypothetical protein